MNIHPKVIGGSLAGAVTIILMWGVTSFGHIPVPAEVASAVTTVLTALVAYFVPGA